MDSRRHDLRDRIAQSRAHTPEKHRYGDALKREITDYALDRQTEGEVLAHIARDLALAPSILGQWVRHAKRRRARGLRPFERIAGPTTEQLLPPMHRRAAAPEPAAPEPAASEPAGSGTEPANDDANEPATRPEPGALVVVIHCGPIHIESGTRARLRELLSL